MSEQIVRQNVKFTLFKKLLFNLKVNKELKNCYNIESHLHANKYLSKSDSTLNLIFSNYFDTELPMGYFLYKGYTQSGSLTNLKKYTINNGKIVKYIDAINHDIIIVDLYEESTYLHSYTKDENFITGYIIKEEKKSGITKNLIFTNEEIKINIKNINKLDTIAVVDDFINRYII